MTLLSLLVPTRRRIHLLHQFLSTLHKGAESPEQIEVVLYIDEDDEDTQAYQYDGLFVKKCIGPKGSLTMTRMNQAAFEVSSGRYVGLLNTDVVVRTRGWDRRILDAFQRFLDDTVLVYPNDGYYGHRVSTFPFFSRSLCEWLGGVCPVDYRRHYIDSHWFDIFERLDRLGHRRRVYLKDVVFEHMHYGLGLALLEGRSDLASQSLDRDVFLRHEPDRIEIADKLSQRIVEHFASGVASTAKNF